jgi:hypothetical protein
MSYSDSYVDPYMMIYQTPKKKEENNIPKKDTKNKPINVFKPYQNGSDTPEEKSEDKMPEFVDLSDNAYKKDKVKEKILENSNDENQADDDDDLPLLEELGVYPQNIKEKLISVLTFHKVDKQILEDSDMAGPLLVFILFAATLILVNFK